jgi:hypothetical protein
MSLKSQIETAKDAVSKALITALENKNETAVTDLFTCYNTLNKIEVTEPYNFTITSTINNIPCGAVGGAFGDDVISFTGLG